jgi:hypothetical protein
MRLQAESGLKKSAKAEAIKSQRVSAFLGDMLKGVGPAAALGSGHYDAAGDSESNGKAAR